MSIAAKIETFITKSSWIRKMFEEGACLKEQYGAENVFDFSLGNPNLEPPHHFKEALKEAANDPHSGIHAYMPNTGYPHVRKQVAEYISKEQSVPVTDQEIIMTCGAAGALNVILKTIIDPGDEVLTPAPYFVEYNFYADNHGGVLKTVPTHADFTLDLDAMAAAITPRTKGVLINSPNNPTGQMYSKESLDALGGLLTEKSRANNRTIYLISDEPYRKIVYDNRFVPSIFASYKESIMGTSYSKDISVPGERIGFLAIHPDAAAKKNLISGMAFANRILGFVNAPALLQRAIAMVQGESVDISIYARKRDLLCDGLKQAGYEFTRPAGTFYLFPRSPIEDDVAFVQALQEERVLVVPGSGFGGPGYFRIAFCVNDATIEKAMPGFERAMKRFK